MAFKNYHKGKPVDPSFINHIILVKHKGNMLYTVIKDYHVGKIPEDYTFWRFGHKVDELTIKGLKEKEYVILNVIK